MRVCKTWKFMCRDRQLWKDLRLVKNWHKGVRSPLRPGTLNNIVKLSGNMATSLTIDGLLDFNLDGGKLRALLKALPELKALSLTGSHGWSPDDQHPNLPLVAARDFSKFWTAICENAPSSLVKLHLSSFNLDGDSRTPRPVLSKCQFKESLQELSLVRVRVANACLVEACNMSEFTSINTLNIQECRSRNSLHVHLEKFLPNYTSLRSLTLDRISVRPHQEIVPRLDCEDLQRLVLGNFHTRRIKLPTSKILRSLELNNDGLNSLNYLGGRGTTEKPFLPALEHFRCHFDPHKSYLHLVDDDLNLVDPLDPLQAVHSLLGILRPSVANGTLRSLDLTLSNEVKAAVDALFTPKLEDNGKSAIRILSCDGLLMPSIVTGFGGNCDEFLDWVDTFPNLTTVGAYPQKSDNAYMLILWLMRKRPDIKTIYTNVLKGAERDMVLSEAKKRHITVIHADRVPEPLLGPK